MPVSRLKIYALLFLAAILTTPVFSQDFEIDSLTFIGNNSFEKDELQNIIQTEEGETFDARLVKIDKILMTNFYRKQGYLTVDIMDTLAINRTKQTVSVIYRITEGPRYYMGGAQIEGNHLFPDATIQQTFEQSPVGSPFDEAKIVQAGQLIENLYYDNGKPFVDVNLDYRFEQDSLVIVLVHITENQTIYIKKVNYLGLKQVQEFIVRRELEFHAGDLYSRRLMTISQQNIYSTGLFDYVKFEIEPIPGDSSDVYLNIQLQEKDARWIGFRVGFAYEQELSYGNKLEVTLEGGHRNLFGTARSLSLHIVPSFLYDIDTKQIVNPDNHITMVYVEPWIGYTRTPGVVQLGYHQYRPINSAAFDVYQISFGVSHDFQNQYSISSSIQAKYVNQLEAGIVDTTLDVDVSNNLVYTVSVLGRRNTKNSFFNPTNGASTDLSVAFSHSLGQTPDGRRDTKDYFTIVPSWQRYQPLGKISGRGIPLAILATRIKAGMLFEMGLTRDIPISDLFFAGGATTVRGYPEQLLGPTTYDQNGYKDKALGGKLLYLMNAEIRIPIYWLFMGEIFVDGGNVWRELEYFNIADIKFTTGAGLVLLTPVGPIRFDYGYKLMPEKSDKAPDAFHLGFYFAF
jgi:outer membrane protein insertion porin family